MLDDGNFEDRFLVGCEESALERGHTDCAELFRIMKKAKRTQREKLTHQGHWLYDSTTTGCPWYMERVQNAGHGSSVFVKRETLFVERPGKP